MVERRADHGPHPCLCCSCLCPPALASRPAYAPAHLVSLFACPCPLWMMALFVVQNLGRQLLSYGRVLSPAEFFTRWVLTVVASSRSR